MAKNCISSRMRYCRGLRAEKKTMMEIQEEADVWIVRRKTPMINYRNNKRK